MARASRSFCVHLNGRAVTALMAALPVANGATVYSQDGYGFSGVLNANPLKGNITMVGCNSWPSGFTTGNRAFYGGAFDGHRIWLAPYNPDRVVAVDTRTGFMSSYSAWPSGYVKGSDSFAGAVFDGHSVWLIPCSSTHVIKVDTESGSMQGFNSWPQD